MSANFAIVTSSFIQNAEGLILAGNRYIVNQVLSLKLNSGNTVKSNINTRDTDSDFEENTIMSIINTPL